MKFQSYQLNFLPELKIYIEILSIQSVNDFSICPNMVKLQSLLIMLACSNADLNLVVVNE